VENAYGKWDDFGNRKYCSLNRATNIYLWQLYASLRSLFSFAEKCTLAPFRIIFVSFARKKMYKKRCQLAAS